jgi:four helix bundle protein
MKINSFKELIVWQKSIVLVNEIYTITKQLPKSETYGLSSQMQRAAVAIPSNIAEGYRRNHRPEFIQFLAIAISSASELETQVIICQEQYKDVDYLKAEALLEEIQKMLYAMISKLKG